MKPSISIGLTFYNNADTLEDAIKSVYAQTFHDWELIIIDDHSSDGSLEIVQSIRDPRVRVITDVSRKGFVYQLNQLTRLAKGKYFARMDADDLLHPERLEKQMIFLENNSNIDVADTAVYSMDKQGRVVGIRGFRPLDYNAVTILRGGLLIHATVMGRTEWFQQNPYDPRYFRAEDCELFCRTFRSSQFGRIKEPLYFVREGRINVNNYLSSCRTVRLITKNYGPCFLGRLGVLRLIIESHAKGFIYQIFSQFDCHELLVNFRNSKLNSNEKECANNIVAHILSTSVPRIDLAK